MKKELFIALIEKYLAGKASKEEETLVEEYYIRLTRKDPKVLSPEEAGLLEASIIADLKAKIHAGNNVAAVLVMPKKHYKRWAAAVLVLAISVAGILHFSTQHRLQLPQANGNNPIVSYTRYLTLPDSSTIVLHGGSSLELLHGFNANNREVKLTGEAYFDIKHNPDKPFIIHTGTIKTTVMGTAFNIKAYAGSKLVVVSVTRGKVQVDNSRKVLAVLQPNQQITYNLSEAKAKSENVNAAMVVTDWTKTDMIFDSMSFGTIVDLLNKRYGATIRFGNESLRNCPIRASFSGTEGLSDVLSALCIIRGASYEKEKEGTYVINGQGCQ